MTIQVEAIGLSVGVSAGHKRMQRLAERLDAVQQIGYELVELSMPSLGLIFDGEVHRQAVDDLAAVTRQFDLRYTVHGLNRLNLAYDPRHALSQRIMAAQIEVAQAIGADVLVYHSGLQALDAVHRGVRHTLLRDEELAEGAAREVAALKVLGDVAADAGVVIGMENGDSHLWEHALLARHGQPHAALSKHHARLHIPPIVRQLEAIDHPNVGMTLDIAHLHIAANDMGFHYLDAISEAAPWVRHLHANDNFGRLDWGFNNEPDRWPYGEADVHLPPGWGLIPYTDVFARLPDYRGKLILEIKEGFADYLDESLTNMRGFLSQTSAQTS